MPEIRLTPAGSLHLELGADTSGDAGPVALRDAFEADWREALFDAAARRMESAAIPALHYWQTFAELLVTRLCHLPEGATADQAEAPTEAECAEMVLSAPPMQGGEYLNPAMLAGIWQSLVEWCTIAATKSGGLTAFLSKRAPRWHQVGRVCFHLAENKADPNLPFAFMATFVSGLGAGGKGRHQPLRQALEQYAGADNRPALIKLLSPVKAAADRCPWVKQMVDSGEVYQPKAWPPDRAHQFLQTATILEECGLAVRLPNWWQRRPRPQVSVRIGSTTASQVGLDSLLSFDVQVALAGENLTEDEITELLDGGEGLVLLRGQWVEVDRERLREALDHWKQVKASAGRDGVAFIEGMRMLAGAPADLKEDGKQDAAREWAHVKAGGALQEILAQLRDPDSKVTTEPLGLHATLRPYQRKGVEWLGLLTGMGLGACLADDMGLGKTIQVLALLLAGKKRGRPSLLVVPASLLGNWRREAERFAPSLQLVFLHPSETERNQLEKIGKSPQSELSTAHLVVTSYSMITRMEWLAEVDWNLVILDEAQAIKNPGTRQCKAVKKLKGAARIALTGTPVENRLGDLWSIFDFINPGLLGSATVFKSFVKSMNARQKDQYAPLRKLVSPYILRRMKTDRSIISDLPDKVETPRYCNLSKEQIRLYQQVVKSLETSLKNSDGIARRGLVLQSLMRLKQVCNHPSQLTGDGDYDPAASGKFRELAAICEELAARQDRVLVFTQFREIIDPIASHLATVFGRPGLVLHGDTAVSKRKDLVDQFQRDHGPPFFVLSLKAGGTGLTLTAASHVIHFDRWWNPAVEDQATDRAFRIGQRRNVLVHKFVTTGSVEERIDKMISDKRQLAGELFTGSGELDLTSMDDRQLIDLVRLDVRRASTEGD